MWTRIRSRISDAALSRLVAARSRLERFRDEEGAMTIEYILIIALIAIIIITLFTILLWPFLKPALQDLIKRITDAIAGEGIN